MRVIIKPDYEQVTDWAATYIAYRINRARPTPVKPFVLGLPMGDTPKGMYKKLDKFTVEYVIDSIKQCTRKANNIRAVLLTALYNATLTANSYITNLFAYQEAIPQT